MTLTFKSPITCQKKFSDDYNERIIERTTRQLFLFHKNYSQCYVRSFYGPRNVK